MKKVQRTHAGQQGQRKDAGSAPETVTARDSDRQSTGVSKLLLTLEYDPKMACQEGSVRHRTTTIEEIDMAIRLPCATGTASTAGMMIAGIIAAATASTQNPAGNDTLVAITGSVPRPAQHRSRGPSTAPPSTAGEGDPP